MANFKVYSKVDKRLDDRPMLTITKTGVLMVSVGAYKMLDEPKKLVLLYDADEKLLGIRAPKGADEERDAYSLIVSSRRKSQGGVTTAAEPRRSVSVSGLLGTIGYGLPEKSKRWLAEYDDGVLFIDLKTDGIPTGRWVRPENSGD